MRERTKDNNKSANIKYATLGMILSTLLLATLSYAPPVWAGVLQLTENSSYIIFLANNDAVAATLTASDVNSLKSRSTSIERLATLTASRLTSVESLFLFTLVTHASLHAWALICVENDFFLFVRVL